ncbi:cobalamin-binding protein [Colwellia sp. Arc7-D]|jgi:iron complex transport system substrate-binding protein|uniref:cobalamin-binding protein n=1 Tax=Colwellia sp. Arc7-D TaxID=2161872 RepID=UPI000D3846E5|nr:cobalamin-binding protein [Colwellia sp. Arc7-D]AWB56653.1 cobalamin-binding protein [Colwellia sp. Arc7-D]|tara:strand:+ start:2054 stop:2866 length:813 start_codon:yes stop_codon:yes gene_type:complete
MILVPEPKWPERIICLTEETTEALYLMEEDHRIVGISAYTMRPERARKEKTKVSAYITARTEKILSLKPDLVLAFSDMQADIVADLIKEGIQVHCFNHRSISEILQMIRTVSALIGQPAKGDKLVADMQDNLRKVKQQAEQLPKHPKVYFEEWFDPIITGIGWVSELIEIAGGIDCYQEFSTQSLAKNRIVADASEVIAKQPDIYIASWCGRKFDEEKVTSRVGWQTIPAIKNGDIFEINSTDILQPGPAALTDGVAQLAKIIKQWAERT